jgi:predicted N-formylglutamate amidohydrolase
MSGGLIKYTSANSYAHFSVDRPYKLTHFLGLNFFPMNFSTTAIDFSALQMHAAYAWRVAGLGRVICNPKMDLPNVKQRFNDMTKGSLT